MSRLKILIGICCVLWSVNQAFATHIVGGEFEIQERTNGNYDIHLNLYFDQVNGNPGAIDPNIRVAIYRRSDEFEVGEYFIPLVTDSIVEYENPDCAVADLSVRLLRYSLFNFHFPVGDFSDPGGYYIVYDRCCRNNAIMNIQSPGAIGMLFYSEFPPIYKSNGTLTGYSSPVFNVVRTRYACLNEYFYLDFGATDADGDSLVFSMANPLIGVSQSGAPVVNDYQDSSWVNTVTWLAGFDSANAIFGTPSLMVDSATGLLELIATQTGLHVFSVKCEEYRNGVKIGEARRDFQILVDVCDPNSPPDVQMEDDDGIGFYVEGDTIFIPNDGNRCFEFFITDDQDPRNNEQISVEIVPKNFVPIEEIGLSNTTGFVGGPGDTLTGIQMCWPECEFILNEPYKIDVIIADDGCILPKKDTIEVTLIVEPEVNEPPVMDLAIPGTNSTYQEGDTIFFPLGLDYCLDLITTDSVDSRKNEVIKFLSDSMNFVPGPDFTYAPDSAALVDTNTVYSQLCWPACEFDSTQLYTFNIIVSDNGCIQPKSDTLSVNMMPYPNAPPELFMKNQMGGGFYNEGDTIYIPKDVEQCFDLYITDNQDKIDSEQVFVYMDPINFTPVVGFKLNQSIGTVGGLGDTLTGINFCWPECEYALGGAYQLNLVVHDLQCTQMLYDTLELTVVVEPNNPPSLIYEMNGITDSTDLEIDLTVDSSVFINFIATDPDSLDQLTLEAFPFDFSFQDADMLFSNVSEQGGYVESPFAWAPDCEQFISLGSEYDVVFIARDNDCYTANEHDSIRVHFTLSEGERDESFEPPNIFTPNGDGVNDLFFMPELSVTSCTDQFKDIEIYNRWGRKVYATEDPGFQWDGGDAPSGMYYFLVHYEINTYKGYFLISR